ncbi:MAG TPA: hypothetical protein VGV59_18275 [Pyrinomonadaceae bacterium]|nr:hypothetical protein [Pyrinomonadaceae bacterium]
MNAMKQRMIDALYPSRLSYWAMRLAAPLAALMLDRLADAYRSLDVATTARLRDNFALAFPEMTETAREELIKKHWRSKFQSEFERIQLNAMPREQLIRFCRTHVEIEGERNFRAACESSRPVIFFTPHYGNFAFACVHLTIEVGAYKTISFFYDSPEVNPTTAMYKGLIERLECNAKTLYNDKTAVLKGLRALKNGNALGMMPDVYEYNPGLMYVPFFGRLAVAMGGTAFFALKSDALLIPLYCYRRSGGRFIIKYGAPVELSRTDDFARDMYVTTARIHADMQRQLTALPEHWVYWPTLDDRFGFAARTELPRDEWGWMERFFALRSELAEEHSSLAGFLSSFEARLRHGISMNRCRPGEMNGEAMPDGAARAG